MEQHATLNGGKFKEYESNRQYYDDLIGKFPDRGEVRP